MSVEALWTVNFATGAGRGNGIVVFETGRIFGGDAHYFWVGDYNVQNGRLAANLNVSNYSGMTNSVFGQAKSLRLKLEAALPPTTGPGQTMEARGHLDGSPNQVIVLILTYRAPLP
ncbi:MAG: GrlR family regulatory protein [Candidatus Binatus sp.]